MPTRELPPQHEAFVTHYLANGFNAIQAVISAGYSKRSARSQSYRLLKNADIQHAISRKQASVAVRVEYTHSQWLRDQLDFQREAKSAGAWGAVGKFSELIGRHIGALTSDRRLNRDEAEFFTYLGAQMQEYRSLKESGKQGNSQLIESPAREIADQ